MKVTEQDVTYVAQLAHLDLTYEERTHMLRDLNSIFDYMDRLNRLDTTEVSPMTEASARLDANAHMREDAARAAGRQLDREAVLRQAPESDGTFFKVPKVIDK